MTRQFGPLDPSPSRTEPSPAKPGLALPSLAGINSQGLAAMTRST